MRARRERSPLLATWVALIVSLVGATSVWAGSASVIATDGGGAVTVTVNGSFSSCTTCDANGNNCSTTTNGSVALYWGGSYLGGAAGSGSATFTKQLDRRSVNGTQTFTGYANDCTGSTSSSTSITIDNTPTVSVTGPSGTISAPFDITGTATFKPTLSTTKGTIAAYLNGAYVGASKTCTTESCNFSYQELKGTLYDLSSGSYTVTLTATGGGKSVSASSSFTVDKTPTVSVSGPIGTVSPSFDITGTATFKPTLSATKGTIAAYLNGAYVGASKTCTTETCSFSYQEITGKLYNLSAGGPYTVQLTASGGRKSVSSTATFYIVDGSSCMLNRPKFGSSANLATGDLVHTQDLIALRGTGLPTHLTLTYARLESTTTPLGRGWTHSYAARLAKDTSSRYMLIDGAGTRTVLVSKGGSAYGPIDAPYPALTVNADLSAVLTWRDGRRAFFSAAGSLLRLEDRNANAVVLTYTGGTLTSVTDSAGRVTTFTYDAAQRITQLLDPPGATHTFTYTDDLLTTVTTTPPPGAGTPRTWQYTYTPEGLLASKTDPRGDVTSYTYDAKRRVNQSTAPDGQVRTVLYPDTTTTIRTTTLTEQDGGVWTSTYDVSKGVLLSQTDPLGHATTHTYDTSRRLLTTTASDGSVTTYTYDAVGNVATVKDALNKTTSYTYNTMGEVTSVTDPLGRTTTSTYDAVGNLLTTTDPTGATTTYTYDTAGRVTQVTTALNQVILLAYDAAGNLTSITDPLGAVTSFAYDVAGNVTSQTDALGRVTTSTYDSYNQPVSRTTPDGATATWTYDATGNRLSETDANSHTTTWTYNYNGQVLTATDAAGNVTSYTYGASNCGSCGGSGGGNRLLSVTDPTGATTSFAYDAAGRRTSVTDAMSHVTSYTYDSRDRVATITDAQGKTTSYTYDAVGRVLTETDPLSGVTRYSYDAVGNLLSVTDPKNSVTQYTYDAANRRTSETRPLGQTTTYAYDAGGNLTSLTDAKGQVTTFTYDAANRLTARAFADGTSDTFSYNAVGNLTGYSGSGISGTLTYDAQHRKLSEAVNVGSFTKTYSYTYDGVGNETSVTTPEGAVSTYAYNAINQPTSVTSSAGTLTATYDHGRLNHLAFPNGVATDYQYTATSWLSGLTTTKGALSVLTRQYTFDGVGNIVSRASETGSTTYTYDALSRLTDVVPPVTQPAEHYTYDAVGNRLTSAATAGTWTYNANHQLLTYGATTNSYDANGQLLQTTDGAQITTLGYNSRNRLAQVTLPDGRSVAYTYDPFGRRVKKDVAGTVTYFLYSDEGLLAEYNATGTLQRGYGWWPQSSWGTAPVVQTEGGQTYAIHTDHLGTPQKLTDATGAVVWSATYTAFGEASVDPASTITHNLRFPGQYFDQETGLHYNMYRDYAPTIGRYLGSDPLGLIGGLNTYRYVRNNPQRLIDPLGLLTVHIWNYRGSNEAWGHASITLDNGVYISWWPGEDRQGRLRSLGIYSAPAMLEDYDDVTGEGQPPDYDIQVNGLDESAIEKWWNAFKGSHQWETFDQNCSTTTAEALKAGGAERYAGWWRSRNYIWKPNDVKSFAESINQGMEERRKRRHGASGRW